MKFRSILNPLLIVGLGACAIAAVEIGSPASTERLVPVFAYVLDYQFYDHWYTEDLSKDSKYSVIEAYVKDNGGNPRTTIKLVDRSSGNASYYSQNVQYSAPKQYIPSAQAGFALRDKDGAALRWRFVLAYPPSAQGSGLTVLPNEKDLKLFYRESGSLGDASSAVEVNGKVDAVQEWKEISQPPFFVAYRATYTEGAEAAELRTEIEKLNFSSAPRLRAGARFQASTASGKTRRFAVDSGSGALLIRQETDENQISRELIVEADGAGYRIRQLKVQDGAHQATVLFEPSLPVTDGASADFKITAEKNRRLADGRAQLTRKDGSLQLTWKVNSPNWAKKRTLVQTLSAGEAPVAVAQSR